MRQRQRKLSARIEKTQYLKYEKPIFEKCEGLTFPLEIIEEFLAMVYYLFFKEEIKEEEIEEDPEKKD